MLGRFCFFPHMQDVEMLFPGSLQPWIHKAVDSLNLP
jgi:hypothetical protein